MTEDVKSFHEKRKMFIVKIVELFEECQEKHGYASVECVPYTEILRRESIRQIQLAEKCLEKGKDFNFECEDAIKFYENHKRFKL